MDSISVIVSVYNTEKWLGECLESIIKQTSISHAFNKTPEYEQMFSEIRMQCIPSEFLDDYFEVCIRNRINGLRCMNYFSLNTKTNSRSFLQFLN